VSVHTRAPLRIDFAGGWTDVQAFAARHGGCVVNAAITLSARADFLLGQSRIRLHAEDLGQHLTLASPAELAYDGTLDLHKAALNMLPVTGGIEILTRSDAPAGSGLGASGALDVALMAGLAQCREEAYSRAELAELGYELETAELRLLGGRQDQYAAALGGFHELTFRSGPAEIRPLSVAPAAAADLERHLVLAYTGQSHFSSHTHARVWEAFAAGDAEVCAALSTMGELAPRAADALEASDWPRLAAVVGENWRQQQRLDGTISTKAVRRIEAAARDAGAWGLKATGAGAGGCLAILCADQHRAAVEAAVRGFGARILPFAFDFEGVAVWEEDDAPTAG
jgi:D-glycero-alpha-D-manno-heptose-7-phosphate kinase